MYTFLKRAALEYWSGTRSGLGRPDVVLQKRPQFVDLHGVGLDLPFSAPRTQRGACRPESECKGRAWRPACVGERGLRQRNPERRGRPHLGGVFRWRKMIRTRSAKPMTVVPMAPAMNGRQSTTDHDKAATGTSISSTTTITNSCLRKNRPR